MLFDPDVRAIIRLLGDLSLREEALPLKKRALLGQLCELIEGDRWRWALERRVSGRRASRRRAAELIVGLEGGRVGALGVAGDFDSRVACLRDDSGAPSIRTSTATWEGASDGISEGGPPASMRRRPAEKTPGSTLTVRQISGEVVSSICLMRDAGRPPFSAKEIKMAQIVLSEIPWLHEPSPGVAGAGSSDEVGGLGSLKAPDRSVVKGLAPRQRAVLIHWVNGLSSRAIAEKLHLSPYTVQDYVKGIYKHYRVNCRAELLRQMTLGWEQRVS